jgi:hypothetical protein
MELLVDDFRRLIVPAITHWNDPGYMAYFANTAPGPSIIAELLSASLNADAMVWKTVARCPRNLVCSPCFPPRSRMALVRRGSHGIEALRALQGGGRSGNWIATSPGSPARNYIGRRMPVSS